MIRLCFRARPESAKKFAHLTDTIATLDYEVNLKLASQQQLVNQLTQTVSKASAELNAAREKTRKEGNDVKGMESGWSFKAFKAAVKGNKEEKMAKEVQQYVAAQQVEKEKETQLAVVSGQLAQEVGKADRDTRFKDHCSFVNIP